MKFLRCTGLCIKNCCNELAHKVSWPTRNGLINNTVVVMVASVTIAIFAAGVDFVFRQLMQLVYDLAQVGPPNSKSIRTFYINPKR